MKGIYVLATLAARETVALTYLICIPVRRFSQRSVDVSQHPRTIAIIGGGIAEASSAAGTYRRCLSWHQVIHGTYIHESKSVTLLHTLR